MPLSDEQRSGLLRAKLATLAADLTGRRPEPELLGATVATIDDGPEGRVALLLTESPAPAALAGAIAWTLRQDAARLVLFVDDLGGDLARMAGWFSLPVDVRVVEGGTSRPAEPAPLPDRIDPADVVPPNGSAGGEAAALREQLASAGLEVVEEDGIVRGEVDGLEVARLVVWPEELGGDGHLHLEAGVGRFDRDAVAAMHQGEPPTETLARTIAMVRERRRSGESTHPLARLARERWLRAALVRDPSAVGASTLRPVETTVVRDSVRDVSPAAALGTDGDGAPVVVVCSTGVDLSMVPVAADTRAWWDPAARLVLAVPARDRVPTLDRLAALLVDPAEVRVVPEPWDAG